MNRERQQMEFIKLQLQKNTFKLDSNVLVMNIRYAQLSMLSMLGAGQRNTFCCNAKVHTS